MQAALPFSSEAAAAAQAEQDAVLYAAHSARVREEASAQARQREKASPFGTAASAEELEAQIAEKEALLLAANVDKQQVDAELTSLGPAHPRTMRDRSRKEELNSQQAVLEKRLSELRMWLKAHAL